MYTKNTSDNFLFAYVHIYLSHAWIIQSVAINAICRLLIFRVYLLNIIIHYLGTYLSWLNNRTSILI
jgi:hypothetical protein